MLSLFIEKLKDSSCHVDVRLAVCGWRELADEERGSEKDNGKVWTSTEDVLGGGGLTCKEAIIVLREVYRGVIAKHSLGPGLCKNWLRGKYHTCYIFNRFSSNIPHTMNQDYIRLRYKATLLEWVGSLIR